jgi:DNA polymerase-3 subunit epsilon/CBS domain-containing protein
MIGLDLVTRVWRRLAAGDATSLEQLVEVGFVAVDLETTGLDPRRDAIVAVAAIPFERGMARAGLVTLVNPGRAIPPESTAIHGIDDAAVREAPPIGDVVPRLDAVCARRVVVGHDVAFDLAMLTAARTLPQGMAPRLALDTRRLARALRFRDTRLEELAPQLGVPMVGRHSADGDARMTGEILLALVPALRRHGVRTVGELLRLQRATLAYD